MRQALVTILVAVPIGIGSSWVATKAQIAVMDERVQKNALVLAGWQEYQLRTVALLEKMQEKIGVTERDILAQRVEMERIIARVDNNLKLHHELDMRMALLEERIRAK